MDQGIDISYAQSPTNTALLGLYTGSLVKFVIAKATEGINTDDSKYALHRANNYKYNKRHAAYHFAWLNQDPIAEVSHFIRVAALKPGEVGCLDIEDWGETNPAGANYLRDKAMRDATSWPTRIQYVLKWMREFKRVTGGTTALYANWIYIKGLRTNSTTAEWAELCTYPLWLADYDSAAAGVFPTVNPKVAGGVTMTAWLHQWTTKQSGAFDGDACMAPEKWNTYAVQEDEMSAAEVKIITDAIAALSSKVDTVTNKVNQQASDADVRAVKEEVAALKDKMVEINGSIGIGNADLIDKVEEITADIKPTVAAAVKDSLGGVTINTGITFPTK